MLFFPTQSCSSLRECSLGVFTQCPHSRMHPGWLWKAFEFEIPGVGKTFRRQIQIF